MVRELNYDQICEEIFTYWLLIAQANESYQQIIETAAKAYADLHQLNLLLEIAFVDEFDNFLAHVIAMRFMEALPALSGKDLYDFSERIADTVWEMAKKSDAYMLRLENAVARNMSRAIRLRFYGESTADPEEIAKFLEDYYRIPANSSSAEAQNAAGAKSGGTLAAYLKNIQERRSGELTLNEISRRCGISIANAHSILENISLPPRDTIFKIAYGLKLSQQQLIEMLDALERDARALGQSVSMQIDSGNKRDMVIYKYLPQRISIEELNIQLKHGGFELLNRTDARNKTVM
jgi:transcriptional regulator with XRE-family HTH domain